MFMLNALFYVLIAACISALSILGYQYVVDGHGLHPLVCVATILTLVVMHLWFTYLITPTYKLTRQG